MMHGFRQTGDLECPSLRRAVLILAVALLGPGYDQRPCAKDGQQLRREQGRALHLARPAVSAGGRKVAYADPMEPGAAARALAPL